MLPLKGMKESKLVNQFGTRDLMLVVTEYLRYQRLERDSGWSMAEIVISSSDGVIQLCW